MSLRGRFPWYRPPGQVCYSPEAIPTYEEVASAKEHPPRNDIQDLLLFDSIKNVIEHFSAHIKDRAIFWNSFLCHPLR